MTTPLTAGALFQQQETKLSLSWLAGQEGQNTPLIDERTHPPHGPLVSYFNPLRQTLVQIIGAAELLYLKDLAKPAHAEIVDKMMPGHGLVIVADGLSVDNELIEQSNASATPLLTTPLSGDRLVNELQYLFAHHYAAQQTLHGVFLEVLGIGTLLTGESNIGKSELALELISRGHRLIADDAPLFKRLGPDVIRGSCPPTLQGFLEVRGLGILNIPAMFGESSIKPSKNLRLIIELRTAEGLKLPAESRLYGSLRRRPLLDVDIPELTLPVASGRNLAVLIEGAVRNHILRSRGYNAADDFITRQQQSMTQDDA